MTNAWQKDGKQERCHTFAKTLDNGSTLTDGRTDGLTNDYQDQGSNRLVPNAPIPVDRRIKPLFHYTCDDGKRAILADGGPLRLGADGFLWLTDLEFPIREALGLTSHTLHCDRTKNRFSVVMPPWDETPPWPAVPWMELRRLPLFRELADALESSPGAMPRHWFIRTEPIQAVAS